MDRIRRTINSLEEMVLAALLAFMTLLTFLQVVVRDLNVSILWSLEATTYSFGALVLFGMSYCVRTQSHIAVDMVMRRLPKGARRVAGFLAIAVCVSYSVLMLYGSVTFVDRLYALGNMARDVPLPKWLLTATMPIGFFLLGLRFLQSGWRLARSRPDNLGDATAAHPDHQSTGTDKAGK